MQTQTPHLSKVLVDGCESLTPCRLLQEDAEISVGEPAPFHSLTLCNADNTNMSQTLYFLFHTYTCSATVKYPCDIRHVGIWIFTWPPADLVNQAGHYGL